MSPMQGTTVAEGALHHKMCHQATEELMLCCHLQMDQCQMGYKTEQDFTGTIKILDNKDSNVPINRLQHDKSHEVQGYFLAPDGNISVGYNVMMDTIKS